MTVTALESWKRFFEYAAISLALLSGIAGLLSLVLETRIAALKSQRQLSAEQRKVLIEKLQQGSGNAVQIHAYHTSVESNAYARQFMEVFTASGWKVEGPLQDVAASEPLTVGVRVVIENKDKPYPIAELIFRSLKEAGVKDIEYEVDPHSLFVIPSAWATLRVGLKPETFRRGP